MVPMHGPGVLTVASSAVRCHKALCTAFVIDGETPLGLLTNVYTLAGVFDWEVLLIRPTTVWLLDSEDTWLHLSERPHNGHPLIQPGRQAISGPSPRHQIVSVDLIRPS